MEAAALHEWLRAAYDIELIWFLHLIYSKIQSHRIVHSKGAPFPHVKDDPPKTRMKSQSLSKQQSVQKIHQLLNQM